MNAARERVGRDYRAALSAYLEDGAEGALVKAYEVGRDAIARHVGLLELIEIHFDAVRAVKGPLAPVPAERFLLEALSAFEMTHRSFREGNAALRKLNERLEAEARRMARILHDEASPLLIGAQLALKSMAHDAPATVRERCGEAKRHLDELDERLRHLAHELRPAAVQHLGLGPSLTLLADGMAARGHCAIDVEYDPAAALPPSVETAIYRIVQEGLANVVRHARAKQAHVLVARRDARVECAVCDDGIGFPRSALPTNDRRPRLGLVGIRERVDALGGSLDISSVPNEGTKLHVTFPLEANPS